MTPKTTKRVTLVTGFPAWNAIRLIEELGHSESEGEILVLAQGQFVSSATELCRRIDGHRAQVIEGDVCAMDLGLSGKEFSDLAARVQSIYHLAGIYFHGVDRETTFRVNVEGTRGVIAFARECQRLERLIHFSTAFVSGRRKGVVLEEELDEGQSFNNYWEESKFEAEKLAQAAKDSLPITIVRPGIVMGDSKTGEIGEFEGPHSPILSVIRGSNRLRMPLIARGPAPLHLVPIDFVTAAIASLGSDDRAAGGTFHITDPNPLSARHVFDLVSELGSRTAPPAMVSPSLVRTILKAPGLERLTRSPRALLDSLDHQCLYNTRSAAKLLQSHDLRCPSFDEYVEAIVSFALQS